MAHPEDPWNEGLTEDASAESIDEPDDEQVGSLPFNAREMTRDLIERASALAEEQRKKKP